jgi:hypothetical protein
MHLTCNYLPIKRMGFKVWLMGESNKPEPVYGLTQT